eukprot:3636743-Pleurochrysis_carterae.AAC.1
MGHWQAFTAICPERKYLGHPLRLDRMHLIGGYVLRGDKCHGCEGHDLFGLWGSAPYYDVVLQAFISVTPRGTLASLYYRLGNTLISGWTMMYKWGHPVATSLSDDGDFTSLLPMTQSLQNSSYFIFT